MITYIHIGNKTTVNEKDIIAIIDIDKTTVSKITRDFLAVSQKKGLVINVSEDLPKSVVICKTGKETRIYISQISPVTLQGRYGKKVSKYEVNL